MIRNFTQLGHEVVVVGNEPESQWTDFFSINNTRYRRVSVNRTGLNPLQDLWTLQEIRRVITEEKPKKILSYLAKANIYTGLISCLFPETEVYPMITGLGSIIRGTGMKNRILGKVMLILFRNAFRKAPKVICQNKDDQRLLLEAGVFNESQMALVNGSGVNTEKYAYDKVPPDVSFLFMGRLNRDKGIIEYLEASRLVKKDFPKATFTVMGRFDSNFTSIKPTELQPYISDMSINYFDEQDDVLPFLKACSVFVLPSYHEGVPKSILEAMSIGRMIITTDAPGCRETVIDGQNGFLVEVGNVVELADAMRVAASSSQLREEMGTASREMAVAKFDVDLINADINKIMDLV